MNTELKSSALRIGQSQSANLQASVNTTDNTPTVIETLVIPDNSVAVLECLVTGHRTSGSGNDGDSSYYVLRARVKKISGTCSVLNLIKEENETHQSWDADISPNSGNIQVLVTGASSTNISWNTSIKIDSTAI